MREVEIKSRVKKNKEINNFIMVDLIIDDKTITTGSEPISSHSFWTKIAEHSQRALKRIEDGNPKMNFDFSLSSMMSTPESRKKSFVNHLTKQNPRLDIEKFMEIAETELSKLKPTGPPDGEHPNPYLIFPINGDLVKIVMASVLDVYINGVKDDAVKDADPLNGEVNWVILGHLSEAPDSQLDSSMTKELRDIISNKDVITKEAVANKLLYIKDMSQYSSLASGTVIRILDHEWIRIGGKIEDNNANCEWRNKF
jgi:hypothetical protein